VIEQTYAVTGPADLDISLASGSLVMEAGAADSVTVVIDAQNTDGWRIHQSGDSITVSYERSLVGRGGRTRIRVIAPEMSSLKANSASADIRARLALGRAAINTASGEVLLGDVGSIAVKTASGDVSADSVEGDLSIRSASGDIRVSRVGGDVSLTTASGDVDLDHVEGSLSASSASGDIHVGAYRGDDLEAATMSGDVVVGLPGGRRVKLKANTLSGSVRLPDRRPGSDSSGPTVEVSLKSVSGDLTIRRVEP